MTDSSFLFKSPETCEIKNRAVDECKCEFLDNVKSAVNISCKSDLIVENLKIKPLEVVLTVINSMRKVVNTEGF